MKPITFKGQDYDLCITFGSIELQSTDRDFIFENGYNKVCAQLEREWQYEHKMRGRLSDYITEYQMDAILFYIQENDYIEVVHDLN